MDIVQQSSASTPPSKRDFSKLLSIIISAVALIIIISLSFFFLQKNKGLTSDIEGKTKEVESLIPKIAYILSLMSETASKQPPQCYSESDKQKIDSELISFGDKTWQDLWRVFIDNTTSSNCSYTPDLLHKALDYGYKKIVEATE